MLRAIDLIFLSLILIFYGIGDVATTLYGMKKYGLKEGNQIMTRIFGESFRWYESIEAKLVMLGGVSFIYYLSRVLYSSDVYQIIWWISASLIVLRGAQVTVQNWQDIQAAQQCDDG